jgi:hypothetical protein
MQIIVDGQTYSWNNINERWELFGVAEPEPTATDERLGVVQLATLEDIQNETDFKDTDGAGEVVRPLVVQPSQISKGAKVSALVETHLVGEKIVP